MKKTNTILGSATLVALVMLLSKCFGFIRQMVIARVYGSNIDTDIYFMSSEFMIGLSGALLSSLTTLLITKYVEISIRKSKNDANVTASNMLTMFLFASIFLIILINLFAFPLAKLLAPSYEMYALEKLVTYLRFFSLTFIFTAFQSIYAAILNANNSFTPGKLYGLVYNPIAIAAVCIFGKFGIVPLIYAYIIANLIQTFLLKYLCRKIFKYKFSMNFWNEDIKQVVLLALPLLLSNIFIQLNTIIDKSICSTLGEGFASYYSYASTLEQFVTGTITVTISLVLLPRYATFIAKSDNQNVIKTFKESVTGLVLLLAPLMAITCVFAKDIVSIVYLRGNFTTIDAEHTAYALIGFAIGFCIIAIREMYIRLHFSYEDTRMPMISNIIAVIINAIFSIILSKYIGVMGVSLATSISAILTIYLLNKSSKKYIPEFKFRELNSFLIKVVVASIIAFLTAIILNKYLACALIIKFIISAVMSLLIYIAILSILDCKEYREVVVAVTNRPLAWVKNKLNK